MQMKHTDPTKKTVAMDKEKYEALKNSLVKALRSQKQMTFKEMLKSVTADLKNQQIDFQGSIEWHLAGVQMDLEARKKMARDANASPQKFGLIQDA